MNYLPRYAHLLLILQREMQKMEMEPKLVVEELELEL
jgi:hypothetical protein